MNKQSTVAAAVPAYDAFSQADDDGVDLASVLSSARRRLGVIVITAALVFGAALLYIYSLEPSYQGEATVLLEPQNDVEALLELNPEAAPQRSNTLNNQIQVMRSTVFLERVIADNNLLEHPEFSYIAAGEPAPARSPVGLFFAGYGIDFSFDPSKWTSLSSRSAAERDGSPVAALVEELARRLNLTPMPGADVVAVRFTASTPERAAEFSNLIVTEFLNEQIRLRTEAAARANGFLTERLEDLREQVRLAERAVAEFASENQLVEEAGQSSVVEQRVAQVNEQLSTARGEAGAVEARLRRLQSVANNGAEPEAVLEVVSSSVIESLRAQRGELRRTLSEYSTRYGAAHPRMIELRVEIFEVEEQISAEVNRITATVRSDLQVAQSRVTSLEEELEGLQGEQANAGVARVQLRELQRNAQSARSLYETFLNRSTEINQQTELERGEARVISQARPPEDATGPRKLVLLAAGGVLAMAAGGVAAMLMQVLDRGLHTRAEVESELGVPLLASVPLVERRRWRRFGKGGPSTLVTDEPLGAFAESLRTLRSAISLTDFTPRTKAVLFTSSLPNEGKTTTAIAMARSAAESGQRVLLVDCDLRNPHVAMMLNLRDSDVGLPKVVSGAVPLKEAVQKDPETMLDVLVSGSRSGALTEVFGTEAFRLFLEDARADYDLVVLDAAPILAVNDTRQVATTADVVVYVIAWARTPRDAAAQGLAALRDCDAPIRGAVLAMMDMKKMQRYGGGDAAFYHNRYRAYYAKRA